MSPPVGTIGLLLRRLAAYFVDCFCIVAYAGLLFLVTVLVLKPQLDAANRGVGDAMLMQLVGLATLTVPVVLACAFLESRPRGATLGKRLLGLRVRTGDGGRVPFSRALGRNALKFAPWELSHSGVHQSFVVDHPVPWLAMTLSIAGMVLVLVYVVGCVCADGRTPYDVATQTRVERIASGVPGSIFSHTSTSP